MARIRHAFSAEQEAAIAAHGTNVLISAAAGSGKTDTLTERVIRLLSGNNPEKKKYQINRFLITTFTVAAAAVLKDRIRDALSDELVKNPKDSNLHKQILLLGSAHICTIDSFHLDIVRANFEKLGMNPKFRIADEAELLLLQEKHMKSAIESMYRKYGTSDGSDPLFLGILDNPFSDLMNVLLEGRDESELIPTLISTRSYYDQFSEGIERLKRDAEQLKAESEASDITRTQDLLFYREKMLKMFRAYSNRLDVLEAEADKTALDQKKTAKLDELLEEFRSIIAGLTHSFETEGPDKWTEKLEEVSFRRWDHHLPVSIKNLRDQFKTELENELDRMENFSPEDYRNELSSNARCCSLLYELLSEFDRTCMEEKIRNGICSFADITHFALKLLKENPEIAGSWRERFDEICVDEYQDLSPIQDEIFRLISRDNRFMVGDMKQSIYGFRGAEPGIFSSYRNGGKRYNETVNCLFMSRNFRCSLPIIHFTNLVCGHILRACGDSIGYQDEDDLQPGKHDEAESTPVTLYLFEKKSGKRNEEQTPGETEPDSEPTNPNQSDSEEDSEENSDTPGTAEMNFIAAKIRSLHQKGRYALSDIAILTRTVEEAAACRLYLSKMKFPVAEDGSFLKSSPSMKYILNLLDVINNPHNDTALSEWLLDPHTGFSPDELLFIHEKTKTAYSLYDDMMQFSVADLPDRTDVSDRLVKKCSDVLASISSLRHFAASHSADEILRELTRRPELIHLASDPCLLFTTDRAFSMQSSGYTTLYSFIPALKRTIESIKPSAEKVEDALTVMNIHKAKGLEFPVVFVINLKKTFSFISKNQKYPAFFSRVAGPALSLYHESTNAKTKGFHFATVLDRQAVLDRQEEMRLLYVALTRAKERLYLVSLFPSVKKENNPPDVQSVLGPDPYFIFRAQSYLDWLFNAISHAPGSRDCFRIEENPDSESIAPEEPISLPKSTEEQDPAAGNAKKTKEDFEITIQTYFSRPYKNDALRNIPSKIAASKAKDNFLDTILENDSSPLNQEKLGELFQNRLEIIDRNPESFEALLNERKKPTPAEIGTATHTFMQFVPYKALYSQGAETILDEMVSKGYLGEKARQMMNLKFLENFRRSILLQKLLKSPSVYREYEFNTFADLSSFTSRPEFKKKLAGNTIQVRGSIDLLYFSEDGQMHLVDYKTDRLDMSLNDAELSDKLFAEHGQQLRIYRKAIEDIFGKKPDTVSIFSFVLGKEIDLSDRFSVSGS